MEYKKAMDNLQRLEHEVHRLMSELREAQAKLARAEELCASLQEQNRAMRRSLDDETVRREKILTQIDAVISKIEAQCGAENVE